jgi:hypothetical protein
MLATKKLVVSAWFAGWLGVDDRRQLTKTEQFAICDISI